ncbi:MAG: 1,2-phenylacetyl-CoA epoxidase subunit PaaD [Bacteroidia bacterium]|nr:phenylacetate-CoA oxygenase subunit PaaJ [Bacteroidia bacterium]MDW8333901.1 1,2-phenylacetyl-CoA epoxidase subunit PaaD [Bacteroidia bacterium]
MTGKMSEAQIREWLNEVKDPEIPTVSLVELGVIERVELNEEGVKVRLIPTFAGCFASSFMAMEAKARLEARGLKNVVVEVDKLTPWESGRITPEGRQKLLAFGISPPGEAICPKCLSRNVEPVSEFGPTLCRAVRRCLDCLETFEQFKTI